MAVVADSLEAQLHAMREEQARQGALLQRILQAIEKPRRHKAAPVSNETLVAAIAASNPAGACFSAGELIAHAAVHPALRQALAGGLMDTRRLGNRLRTLAGLEIAGLVLQRVGRDETGCIWQLVTYSVSPFSGDGCVMRST